MIFYGYFLYDLHILFEYNILDPFLYYIQNPAFDEPYYQSVPVWLFINS